jgi:hypothetical protein
MQDVIWCALEERRLDIVVALIVNNQTPVNRREYWHQKYRQQLAKPNVYYWIWKENPESREICPELTALLTLPEPSFYAYRVLECLAEGKDPFFKPEFKGNKQSDIFLHIFYNMDKIGALADCKPEQKQAYRQAFAEWHLAALAHLGRGTLERIYKVVYGVDWILVESIINVLEGESWEILGIRPGATLKEARAAMKKLVKQWHPDVNPSPLAKSHIIRINQAFEEFEKTCNR